MKLDVSDLELEDALGYLISSIKRDKHGKFYVTYCYGIEPFHDKYSPHISTILTYARDGLLNNVDVLNKHNEKINDISK